MKCPYCGKDMKIGLMYSSKVGVMWLPEGETPRRRWDLDTPKEQKGYWIIPIWQNGMLSLNVPGIRAEIGEECGKIIAKFVAH